MSTELVKLGSLMSSVSVRGYQVTTDHYGLAGAHPIVDQGKALICGYTDAPTLPCRLPVTVFGDHTREVKFIDFPFVVGADGTKVLEPSGNQDPRYLSALISLAADKIANLGYARHFKELKEAEVPYVSNLSEQRRIATVLDIWDSAIATAERLTSLQRGRLEWLKARWCTSAIAEIELSAVCSINASSLSGRTPAHHRFEYFPIGDDEGAGGWMTFGEAPSRARRRAFPGDVIYSTVRPMLRRLFIAPNNPSAVYSTGYAVLAPKEGQSGRFIYHCMTSRYVEQQIEGRLTGSNYPAINSTELGEVLLPHLSAEDQARFAAVMDAAEQSAAASNNLAVLLRRQKRGLMQKLLTGEWCVPATDHALDPGGPAIARLEAVE